MFDISIINRLTPTTNLEDEILKGIIPKWLDELDNDQVITRDRRTMLSNGLLYGLVRHPRFLHFPQHRHQHVELVVMIQGNSEHIVNGKKITLQEGELLFMHQGTVHEVNMLGENDLAVNINFLPEFFGSIFGIFESTDSVIRNFCLDALAGGTTNSYLHYRVGDNPRVQYMLNFIIYNLLFMPSMYASVLKNAFALFFQLLEFCSGDLNQYVQDKSTVLPVVMRYIEENYATARLEELASYLHTNKSALSRFIKKASGKNFIELVQEKRMSAALSLLINTNKSISEIALETGYNNASYFYKLFKQTYSVTPDNCRGLD